MSRPILDAVVRALDGRHDCLVLPWPHKTAEIMVLQTRRVVRKEIIAEHSFNPHVREYYYYHAYPILIETRVKDELTEAQKKIRADFALKGITWVPVRDLDDLFVSLKEGEPPVIWPEEAWVRGGERKKKP